MPLPLQGAANGGSGGGPGTEHQAALAVASRQGGGRRGGWKGMADEEEAGRLPSYLLKEMLEQKNKADGVLDLKGFAHA